MSDHGPGASGERIEVASGDGSIIGLERRGSGPALVAVHGTGIDRTYWSLVVPELVERFTVYVMDRRGRGTSRVDATVDYSLADEVDDVAAVCGHIGEPVFLLTTSYAGLIGLELLRRGDPGTQRVVVYDPLMNSPRFDAVPSSLRASVREHVEAGRIDDAMS